MGIDVKLPSIARSTEKAEKRGAPKHNMYPFWFAAGALVLYLTFFIIPGVLGFYYAFTDWNSFSSEVNFVGLDNFALIFSSGSNYPSYIANTLIFAVLTIVLKTVIGLMLALLLNGLVGRLTSVYRTIMYLPAVLPMLVVGLVFKSILHPATGLLNETLRAVGLDPLAQRWLVDVKLALLSVIGVDTWKGVGYIMVILLAGLQMIPSDYYEAASIDGAGGWARLRYITLPLLRPALLVTTVLNILYAIKVFDVVYVLTNGGPGYTTEVVFTAVFKEFSKGRYGVGTAISTVLFIVMVVIGYFIIRYMSREERRTP
jgi:raffinose/stachyose/melibiose transport system permease protein